jgi:hypothetical protein
MQFVVCSPEGAKEQLQRHGLDGTQTTRHRFAPSGLLCLRLSGAMYNQASHKRGERARPKKCTGAGGAEQQSARPRGRQWCREVIWLEHIARVGVPVTAVGLPLPPALVPPTGPEPPCVYRRGLTQVCLVPPLRLHAAVAPHLSSDAETPLS